MKIRGVIVGEALAFDADAEGAKSSSACTPTRSARSRRTSPARSCPRPCRREDVALQVPADPSPDHIEAGATIDWNQVAIEVEKVLDDFILLLRAVELVSLIATRP